MLHVSLSDVDETSALKANGNLIQWKLACHITQEDYLFIYF